jgi:hypothetical protein
MLSTLLPLSYLSPLRSLTGTSRSSEVESLDEDDSSSDQQDDCEPQDLQPSILSYDTSASTHHHGSVYSKIYAPCASSRALDLANASVELDTFAATRFFGPLATNAVNDLSPLPVDDVLQNVSSPVVSPASENESFSLPSSSSSASLSPFQDQPLLFYRARMYSPRFPSGHRLNAFFVQNFQLDAELGSGGYGFVMAASRRADDKEVAVKFIIKSKVPEHAWTQDSIFGHIPTEILLLTRVDHPYIAKCLDLYEDDIYYYLASAQSCCASTCVANQRTGPRDSRNPVGFEITQATICSWKPQRTRTDTLVIGWFDCGL